MDRINRREYIDYLISTSDNYTCTHLANHRDGVSHAVVSDYLQHDRLTPRSLWEQVKPLVNDSPTAYLLVDDSVASKLPPLKGVAFNTAPRRCFLR